MKRIIAAYTPDGCPVKIRKLVCEYQPYRDSSRLAAGRNEGVFAQVDFDVTEKPESYDEKREGSRRGKLKDEGYGIKAVEFTFVLLDIFDHLLASVQGLAGPGRYVQSRKPSRALWVFEVEGAFSQYHALCFPSQARFFDGTIWRCDREKCLDWVNEIIKPSGLTVTMEDIFPDEAIREGLNN